LGFLKGLYSDIYFINHGFFTEYHGDLNRLRRKTKRNFLMLFFFRALSVLFRGKYFFLNSAIPNPQSRAGIEYPQQINLIINFLTN